MQLIRIKTADPGLPAYSLGTATVGHTGAGADPTGTDLGIAVPAKLLEQPGGFQVLWTRELPGAAPVSQTVLLECCTSDPTVEANWQQADTENTVAQASVQRSVVNNQARFWRIRLSAIGTPNGGVSGQVSFS
jgi:hypothetical protein